MPDLAEFGLLGPVNCSGHPPLGHSDLRLVTVFTTWTRSACCALLFYHTRTRWKRKNITFIAVYVHPVRKTHL